MHGNVEQRSAAQSKDGNAEQWNAMRSEARRYNGKPGDPGRPQAIPAWTTPCSCHRRLRGPGDPVDAGPSTAWPTGRVHQTRRGLFWQSLIGGTITLGVVPPSVSQRQQRFCRGGLHPSTCFGKRPAGLRSPSLQVTKVANPGLQLPFANPERMSYFCHSGLIGVRVSSVLALVIVNFVIVFWL